MPIGTAYTPRLSQAMWAYGGQRIPTTWATGIPQAYPYGGSEITGAGSYVSQPLGEYDTRPLDIQPRHDPLWSNLWKIGAAGSPGRVVPYGPEGMQLSGCGCMGGGCGCLGQAPAAQGNGLLSSPWLQGGIALAVVFGALKLLRGY